MVKLLVSVPLVIGLIYWTTGRDKERFDKTTSEVKAETAAASKAMDARTAQLDEVLGEKPQARSADGAGAAAAEAVGTRRYLPPPEAPAKRTTRGRATKAKAPTRKPDNASRLKAVE